MSRQAFSFGFNASKKQAPAKPVAINRNAAFGGSDDDDSDGDDGAKGNDRKQTAIPKGGSPQNTAPKLKPKARISAMFGDLSSSLTSKKNAEAAQELDPTIYEYDSVYDSLKQARTGAKETGEADAQRKPKYMQGLTQAAKVRKRDALIAMEKKIAREREAEGDEYADKETFVTEAYKRQQEENRRLEEAERRKEEEDARRNKGGGMSAYHRQLLEKEEERHAQAVKAVEQRARNASATTTAEKKKKKEEEEEEEEEEEPESEDKERAEAALARELNEKGASVAVNEDGQVVDKRQLLKGGLNVGAKKREAARREADKREDQQRRDRPGGGGGGGGGFSGPGRKQAMRERQSRMLEEQLEHSLKRSREVDDARRLEAERAAKSRKTEGEISSARERYLARKRAAEEEGGAKSSSAVYPLKDGDKSQKDGRQSRKEDPIRRTLTREEDGHWTRAMRLPTLSAVLLAGLAWTVWAEDLKSITLRTHSLQQPYLDSELQSRWFDFGGDTIVRTDSYIRLTSDRASQSGWLFSRVPLTATNWEIEVEFHISGKHNLYGDGLAMWVTKQRGQPGPVFGSADRFEGLGIFIDTYKNNRPGVVFPYVMAMVGDGHASYDKNNDGKETELAGCSARGLRSPTMPTKLRLTYIQDKQLRLELQYKVEGEWELCFETQQPPTLPNVAYLGFSAETGELSDNHDIISVSAKNLYNSPGAGGGHGDAASAQGKGGQPIHARPSSREGGSWTWFFTKIMLLVLVVGGGYGGWTAYRAKNRSHRF
ncbi:hypothetical protein L249_6468 [Ophiocordyceps polyrhachis-furcata BCC 54312]|uniref:L-type lectin-like domain-containing protein n=1 Tax=Ophiocordyceps polyrhachis-furcata BCC 54312 TaxID=1330021 RepID=A0A367LLE0_9HYPO|nr:hypothetical protein L249_6468 [Ophiocordyceps polyrhachis-furcata BCC 54312]